jgi:hypothetical protein
LYRDNFPGFCKNPGKSDDKYGLADHKFSRVKRL